MRGIIITNKYFISDNLNLLKKYFFDAAILYNIELLSFDNISIRDKIDKGILEKIDFVIFWDKDIKLARYIENKGVKVYNSSDSIRLCDDKALTYINLIDANIKQPKTIFSPLIYYHEIEKDKEFIDYILNNFTFPFILKECFGSFGKQVYMINDENELCEMIKKCGVWPFIIQEFIEESAGKDLRIYLVGNKVVGAMKRENKMGDFRANIELGGVACAYIPNQKEIDIALKVKNKLGLDFCGIDLLFGKDGEPILCEVNSNAYFVSFNKALNVNVANYIMEYIIEK